MPSNGGTSSRSGGGGGGGRSQDAGRNQQQKDPNKQNQLLQPTPQRFVKRYRTEVSAMTSSVLSTATAFPLDSVKTRMQTYQYSGFVECVRHTYQTEKLRGFFRGSQSSQVLLLPIYLILLTVAAHIQV